MDPRSILLRDLGAFPRAISDLLTLEWVDPRGGFLLLLGKCGKAAERRHSLWRELDMIPV